MEFFLFFLILAAIYSFFSRISKEAQKPIKIIALPWILYTCIILLFGIDFEVSNLETIALLSIVIWLSSCFFLVGHSYGRKAKNALYKNTPTEPFTKRSRLQFLIILIFGLLGGIYFITERIQNLSDIDSLLFLDLYQVRISNNAESEFSDRGIISFLSRFLFSFCFLSFCFLGRDFQKDDKLAQFVNILCIATVFFAALISAGRLFIVYYIAGFFLIKYINNEKVKRWQYISTMLVALAMIGMFYFRAPSDASDVKEFYMSLLRIKDVGFFFGVTELSGVFIDSISIVAIYLAHSFGVLSEFYNYSSFDAYAYGGYTFNLPYRIFNKLFSLQIPVLQDYWLDPSLGLYATYARDALADFGIIGSMVFISAIALVSGFSYPLRNCSWPYRVTTYWGLIYFSMAPLLSVISSGFINIMYSFSVLFLISTLLLSTVLKKH